MTRNVTLRHGMAAAVVLFGLAAIAQMPGPGPGPGPGLPPASLWSITTPEEALSPSDSDIEEFSKFSPISGIGKATGPNKSFLLRVEKTDDNGVSYQVVSSESGTTEGEGMQGTWSADCPVPSSDAFLPSTQERWNQLRLYSSVKLEDFTFIKILDE